MSRLIHFGFENDEIEFVTKYVKAGDIFIDIGANIGLFSLVASPIVGLQGKVISYEPTPKTYNRFIENIKLNRITNINAKNIGLSDSESYLNLNISDSGYDAWNTFAPNEVGNKSKFTSTVNVKVMTLDQELDELNKANISLVKIDVEGWEKFVLLGGESFFRKYSPVVMIEFTEENTFAAGYYVYELFDLLLDWGYKWYSYNDHNLIPEIKRLRYPYTNLIAIKNIEHVKDRFTMVNSSKKI